MNVLYNGEYKDIDMEKSLPNWKVLLAQQEKFYPQYEGKKYGDFEIVKIEWDWFLQKQRALLRCIHCGFEKYTNNPREFRRGKSVSQKCDCQKQQKIEKPKKEIINYSDFVGEERNGFVSLDYVVGRKKGMLVCCTECMKEQWVYGKNFLNGNITCNHTARTVYNGDLIGKQFGDLTVIKKTYGEVYLCRCSCGVEKEFERYRLLGGTAKTCGRSECKFHIKRNGSAAGEKRRLEGLEFEHKLQDKFEQAGYEVIRTPDSHDYGVDFIVFINGEKWAFQCKKSKAPATVHAVLEVYAGGRFYDCTRFCVASPSGFTTNAMRCAAKLGVQLEKDKFRFNVDRNENATELLKVANYSVAQVKRKIWEINGITKPLIEWCKEYGVTPRQIEYRMSNGMTFIEALNYTNYTGRTKIEINGETKTKKEWCEKFGVSTQLYDYRTKNGRMTPYEALTTVKRK